MYESLLLYSCILFTLLSMVVSHVIPPPWVDTVSNPCSRESWQLLYWPMDGKCYYIFQEGPCPKSYELTYNEEIRTAQCTCPVNSLLSLMDGFCYYRHSQGPCIHDEYFDWDETMKEARCFPVNPCPSGSLFWPSHKKCYEELTQGPCLTGNLVFYNSTLKGPSCGCDKDEMPEHFHYDSQSCYQHYTSGPCPKGQLYTPSEHGPICSCSKQLEKYYHPDLKVSSQTQQN